MYEEAKRSLTDVNAVIVSIDSQEFSDATIVHRKWENIELDDAAGFIKYLDVTIETVVDPEGAPNGTYKVLRHAYSNREGEREIHQYLAANMRTDGDITSPVVDEATGLSTGSGWIRRSGGNYKGSNNQVMLELRTVDPASLETIVNQNTNDTYTNEIYTVNAGVLTGTWHNIQTTYEVSQETGLATIFWHLSKQANDDLHFAHQKDDGTYVVDLFKYDAADTGVASLETDYYVDALGNWYIADTGDPTKYTQKNGVDEVTPQLFSGEPGYGETLGSLQDNVAGRTAVSEIIRSERTRFYTARVHFEFSVQRITSSTYLRDPFERVTDFYLVGGSKDIVNSAVTDYYFNNAGGWYYSADGENTLIKNGAAFAPSVVVSGAFAPAYNTDYVLTVGDGTRGPSGGTHSSWTKGTSYFIGTDTGWNFIFATTLIGSIAGGEDSYPWDLDWASLGSGWAGGTLATPIEVEQAWNVGTKDTDNPYRLTNVEIEEDKAKALWALRVRTVYTEARSPVVVAHPNGDSTYYGWNAAALPDFSAVDPKYTIVPGSVVQNPDGTYNYVFQARLTKDTASAANNVTEYGTPLVTVTDTIVAGAATLPASIAGAAYNTEGTKLTETYLLQPRFNTEDGTFTYNERVVESWAPHADQTTGEVGYVEGPSELSILTEKATLARGVSSGIPFMGSWSGGGRGVARNTADSDGKYNWLNGQAQFTKKFVPYNITVARSCKVRTSSRLYYYIKEPTEDQYPAEYGAAIEKLGEDEVSNSGVDVVSIVAVDDGVAAPYNDKFSQSYEGKTVTTTYSDGVYTVSQYDASADTGADAFVDSDNTAWRDLVDISTYTPSGIFMYKGHYQIPRSSFFTEKLRHRIVKVAESTYALIVEKVERTPWYADQTNKWIMNAEGAGTDYLVPASNPAVIDEVTAEGTDTVPTYIL